MVDEFPHDGGGFLMDIETDIVCLFVHDVFRL